MFAAAIRAAPPPVEAFGRKPAMIDVDINPAGTRLAWIEDDGKAARIVIHDIATGKELRKVGTLPKTKLWSREVGQRRDGAHRPKRHAHHQSSINGYTDEWQRWVAIDASGGDRPHAAHERWRRVSGFRA